MISQKLCDIGNNLKHDNRIKCVWQTEVSVGVVQVYTGQDVELNV